MRRAASCERRHRAPSSDANRSSTRRGFRRLHRPNHGNLAGGRRRAGGGPGIPDRAAAIDVGGDRHAALRRPRRRSRDADLERAAQRYGRRARASQRTGRMPQRAARGTPMCSGVDPALPACSRSSAVTKRARVARLASTASRSVFHRTADQLAVRSFGRHTDTRRSRRGAPKPRTSAGRFVTAGHRSGSPRRGRPVGKDGSPTSAFRPPAGDDRVAQLVGLAVANQGANGGRCRSEPPPRPGVRVLRAAGRAASLRSRPATEASCTHLHVSVRRKRIDDAIDRCAASLVCKVAKTR